METLQREVSYLRIAGVGDMMIMGGDYSMRVWMKPDVMAQYKLIPSDVTAALAEQNIESATGSFGENSDETYQYTMKYKGRLITPEEFGEIVIRSTEDGEVLKLKDIADVELGKDSYAYKGGMDGHNGVSCMVFQTAGSNATEVNQNIDNLLDEVRKDLPKGVELTQMMSSNDFLFASIHEVVKTLIEAILLVILVVYVFLQDIRSTLIPLVGIIVSLIGTFAFMSVAGFSINLITLFALVLVIGTVVDDAIVVVEAVQSRFDVGYKSPYMASIDAMKGISNAVITSSLVFMAVFIPVSFMSGTSGTFYTQFGLTMAVAVGISAINALTLSPALCALLLRPYINEDGTQKNNFAARFRNSFNAAFDVVVNKYKNAVLFFIKRRWLSWSLLACSVVLLVLLMNSTKTSLVPDEDQGVLFVNVSTAPGSSLKTTDDVMLRIEERLEAIPQKLHIQKVAGYGLLSGQGNTFGMIVMKLKPWDERTKAEADVNITHFNASQPGEVSQPLLDADQNITRGMTSFALENHYEKTSGRLSFFYNWGHHKINDGYAPSEGESPLPYRFHSRDNMMGVSWYQNAQLFRGNLLTAGIDWYHFGGEAWNKFVEGPQKGDLSGHSEEKSGSG